MHYMLMLFENEAVLADAARRQEVVAAHMKLAAEMRERGVFVSGSGLRPSDTATTLRVGPGETTVHDGPFAETREQLGGYYMVDVADLDAALAWARRIPLSAGGSVEIRPAMGG